MAWGAIIGAVISGVASHNSGKKSSKYGKKAGDMLGEDLQFYKSLWNDYQTKYGPMEQTMVDEVNKGLDPEEYADRAQTDVASAFGRAKDIGTRRLTRYGLDPTDGKFQRSLGRTDLDEARAVSGARNKTRQWVDDTNFGRRLAALSYGGGMRSAIMSGMSNARNGLAGYYGNLSGLYGQSAGGMAKSGINFLSDIDWSKFGGDDDQGYADGGLVTDNRVTRAVDTTNLQNEYRRYNIDTQMDGGAPLSWEEWLATHNRVLDDQQLAAPQAFADGGQVGDPAAQPSGRVINGPSGVDQVPAVIDGRTPARLSLNEFVVPADVVMHKGVEHFEKEVQKSRSSRGLDRRIH